MVVLFGLSLLSLLFRDAAASHAIPSDCRNPKSDKDACAQPIEDVIAVTPRTFYAAKIRCYDCPYYGWVDEPPRIGSSRELMFGDQDLFFNVTLSPDKRSVLLNGKPFFPKLSTLPEPPNVAVPQLRPEFSYRNLSHALECRNPSCRSTSTPWLDDRCLEWCHQLQLDKVNIDYLYITKAVEYNGNDSIAKAQYWEFSIDAIGAFAGYIRDPKWGFDDPSQKMLTVIVAGIQQAQRSPKTGHGTLFSPLDDDEKIYDYHIVDVKLTDREFKFPARKPLSFRGRMSRLFGKDIWESQGRLVYMRDEWGRYGKIGTLRDVLDNFIHWNMWETVGIVVGSVVGGLFVIYGIYRLFIWIQEQRELMKWDGMDDVWDKLRREREDEESALLNGQYRDDPGEGSSCPPRYTDDLGTMKPLPTKPLPEKPLPDVPLIDA